MRNVEIKATVKDLCGIIGKAEKLSNSKGVIIKQHDTFFNVSQGRLKLRLFESIVCDHCFNGFIRGGDTNIPELWRVVVSRKKNFWRFSWVFVVCESMKDGASQLIYYERPDTPGPKLCNFSKVDFPIGCNPAPVLTQALGVRGTVKKTRMLYMVEQTRIHIDKVDGLGDFMELEVMLKEEQSLEEGQAIAKNLRKELGVEENDLISGAYVDMILKEVS